MKQFDVEMRQQQEAWQEHQSRKLKSREESISQLLQSQYLPSAMDSIRTAAKLSSEVDELTRKVELNRF